MMKMMINIILALDENNLLGNNNKLPWNYKDDLANFKNLTMNNAVIMGRKTFESIGKELPNRLNIIVSSKLKNKNLNIVKTFNEGVNFALKNNIKQLFVIGGRSMFNEALPICDKIYLTRIHKCFEGNIFYNIDLSRFIKINEKRVNDLSFIEYIKIF